MKCLRVWRIVTSSAKYGSEIWEGKIHVWCNLGWVIVGGISIRDFHHILKELAMKTCYFAVRINGIVFG